MLVLQRMPHQSIVIGGNVRITVMRVKDNKVRLGIEAPREIEVMREELLEEQVRTIYGTMPIGEKP